MTFRNILIIEIFGKDQVKVHHRNLYCGPMNILDIEFYEDNLIKSNISYVLAEVDTTIQEGGRYRYIRGYCLFTRTLKRNK